MKKFILSIIAIVIAISLAGCQSEGAPSKMSTIEVKTPISTEPPVEVIEFEEFEEFEDVEISDSQIFGYMDISSRRGKDPSDVRNLLREDSLVVYAEVLSVGSNAVFPMESDLTSDYQPGPIPSTPITIKIDSFIQGEISSQEKVIYMQGGNALLKDLIEFNEKYYPEGRNEKMGLYELNDDKTNNMYMSFELEEFYKLSRNQKYLLILNYNEGFDSYSIVAGGYGVFEKSTPDERIALRQELSPGLGEDVPDSISSVNARSFAEYGNVLTGFDLDLSVLP